MFGFAGLRKWVVGNQLVALMGDGELVEDRNKIFRYPVPAQGFYLVAVWVKKYQRWPAPGGVAFANVGLGLGVDTDGDEIAIQATDDRWVTQGEFVHPFAGGAPLGTHIQENQFVFSFGFGKALLFP